MATDPTDILKAAMELSIRERAELIARLLETLHGEPKGDVQAAWQAELEQRAKRALSPQWNGEDWSVIRERTRPKK